MDFNFFHNHQEITYLKQVLFMPKESVNRIDGLVACSRQGGEAGVVCSILVKITPKSVVTNMSHI